MTTPKNSNLVKEGDKYEIWECSECGTKNSPNYSDCWWCNENYKKIGKLKQKSFEEGKDIGYIGGYEKGFRRGKADMLGEVEKMIKNIKRFDDKEEGVDFFSGWDNCLDTINSDMKELKLQMLKKK